MENTILIKQESLGEFVAKYVNLQPNNMDRQSAYDKPYINGTEHVITVNKDIITLIKPHQNLVITTIDRLRSSGRDVTVLSRYELKEFDGVSMQLVLTKTELEVA